MELLMPILEDIMNQLQDVIQGLEKEVIKSIVNRRWTRMLFENRWVLDYEAELEDAEILGKFWNKEGYYIIVYNNAKKAPELFKVEFSEWKRMHIGETY